MSELTLSSRETSLQTMSSPNPATPPKNGVCLWETLPKEITDEILQLAYGTPDKPISMLDERAFERMQSEKRFEWDDEEKPFEVSSYTSFTTSRPTSNYCTAPLLLRPPANIFNPAPPVRALHRPPARQQELVLRSLGSPLHHHARSNQRLRLPGLSLVTSVHITHLAQAPRFARLLATQCPRLRHLSIKDEAVNAPALSARWPYASYVHIWYYYWTEEEITGSQWFGAMRVLSGLKSVSLTIGEDDSLPFFRHAPREKAVIKANVELAERLFFESATRPHDPAAVLEKPSGRGRPRVPFRE
jgi:hypothetical protein